MMMIEALRPAGDDLPGLCHDEEHSFNGAQIFAAGRMSVVGQSLEDPQQILQLKLQLYPILRGPIREERVVFLTAPAPLTSHNISFH